MALRWLAGLVFIGLGTGTFAEPISNGDALTRTIAIAGDTDTYEFTAGVGSTILVRVGEGASNLLEPRLTLRDPNGVVVASNSGTTSTAVSHVAVVAGEFEVTVDDATTNPDGTGTYTVYLAQAPGSFVIPAGDEGGALTNGGIETGDIDLGDLDIWSVSADAGDVLWAQVGEIGGDDTLRPGLVWYRPDGSQISTNSGTSSANLAVSASVAGTYTLVVFDATGDATGTGDYTLYFAQTATPFSVPAGDEGGTLTNGGIETGNIDLGDLDIWSVTADAGDVLWAQIAEIGGNDSLIPGLVWYRPDGSQISANVGTSSADLAVTATVAGTYTLVVYDANTDATGTGDYTLYFAQTATPFTVPAGDEGGTLTNGGIETGNIEVGDLDIWTVSADAGDVLWAQIGEIGGNDSLIPGLVWYRPDGSQISANVGTSSADLAVTATVAGTYTLVVYDANTDATGTGDYTLYFAQTATPFTVPAGDEGGTLTNGGIETGNIDLGDLDIWTVSADAGDVLWAQIGEIGGNDSLIPGLVWYRPDGSQISANVGTSSADLAVTATVAGTYTLVVYDANTDATGTGDYTLYFAQTATPFTVPAGDEGGTLTNGATETGDIDLGDLDLWSLTVDARDTIDVAISEVGGNDTLTPGIALYGPAGDLLDFDVGTSAANFSYVATVGGTFTLVVYDANTDATGTGDYDLSLVLTAGGATEPSGSVTASIGNGEMASGVLSNPTDIDKYDVSVTAGDKLRFQLVDLSGSNSIAPTLQAFSASGDLLREVTNNTVADVAFTAPRTETITLVLSNDSGFSAAYNLYATVPSQAISVPAGDDGGALTSGGISSGTIGSGDLDHYTASLSAGDVLRLRLADLSGSNSVSASLRAFASNGDLIDTSVVNTTAEIEYVAETSETVQIEVTLVGASGAGYNLYTSIAGQPATVPAGDDGGPVGNGDIATGSLPAGDIDHYTLPVVTGENVRLRLTDLSGSNSISGVLRVYRPDGSLIDAISNNTVAEITYLADATEDLLVEVSNSSSTGGYNLYVATTAQSFVIPPGDDGGALGNGLVATGSLALGDVDQYELAIEPGEKLRLQLADLSGSNSITGILNVYAGDGALLASTSNNLVARINYIGETSETLRIEVLGTNTSGTQYQLYKANASDAYQTAAPDEGGELSNGVTANGVLDQGDVDLYVFSAQAGDTVTIDIADLSGSNSIQVTGALYGANDDLLASATNNLTATITYIAEQSGPMQLQVLKSAGTSSGYTVTATGIGPFDIDNDGLTDGDELMRGIPFDNPDSDSDGVLDGDEINVFGTDPLNDDTDGDGFTDGEEIAAGTDPLVPNATIPIPLWALILLGALLGLGGTRFGRQRQKHA